MGIEAIKQQLPQIKLPQELREIVEDSLSRLQKLEDSKMYFQESDSLLHWLETILSLPWETETSVDIDLVRAREVLDKNHFGLDKVKERILEYLAVQKLRKENQVVADEEHSPILCFVGLQGIGKTTLASSIAQSLDRDFYRISLGALGSIVQIRGQRRSLPDSEPGLVMKALLRTKVKNPVILLDEIDKVSSETGLRQDVMSSLLEVLDPNQNISFLDHYVDYPFNLSKVLFIATANNLEPLSTALIDRLEIIEMPSYTDQEKEMIGRNYLLPKVLASSGLSKEQVVIAEEVWSKIIRPLGFDAGVRTLDRNLSSITRKVAKKIVEGQGSSFNINLNNLKDFLDAY